MRFEDGVKLNFEDVLIRPKRSTVHSRKEIDLNKKIKFFNGTEFDGIPIIASNMDTVGTFDMADALMKNKLLTCLHKYYSSKDLIDYFSNDKKRLDYAIVSIGIKDRDVEKFHDVYKKVNLKYVCIDVANGYSERFLDFLSIFRKKYKNIVMIAGNVVTSDQTQELILNGVDIVKIGIGSGSVCTTRIKTGVGYPQLSAVMECADAAHGLGRYCISDGGCNVPGDFAKAFAGGADFVMSGSFFAAHDECGGKIITKYIHDGTYTKTGKINIIKKDFVSYYGMSSKIANEKYTGGLKNYRSAEGKKVEIPHKKDIHNTIGDLLGGLRSTCAYVGAINIKNLSKCTTFIRTRIQHNNIFGNEKD